MWAAMTWSIAIKSLGTALGRVAVRGDPAAPLHTHDKHGGWPTAIHGVGGVATCGQSFSERPERWMLDHLHLVLREQCRAIGYKETGVSKIDMPLHGIIARQHRHVVVDMLPHGHTTRRICQVDR